MEHEANDPGIEVPLGTAAFYILLSLADGAKHGYAILKEIGVMTDGTVSLGVGTLYSTIKRMLRAGLITEADERPARALDDERRRYYVLTEAGRELLGREARRLAQAVRLAQARAVLPEAAQ